MTARSLGRAGEKAMSFEPSANPVAEFFLAPFRLRTYTTLLYLWLAFPLGLFYFVTLVTGLSLGVGLLIVWVGVLVLLAVVLFCWTLGAFERVLAQGLLGAQVPRRPLPPVGEVGVVRWLGAVLQSPALYKSLLFLALKFPIGLAGWMLSLTGLSVSLALVFAPVAFAFGGDVDLWFWQPVTVADTLPLAAVGLAMLWVTLNLQNLLGLLWRAMAEGMLGCEETIAVPPAAERGEGLAPATA